MNPVFNKFQYPPIIFNLTINFQLSNFHHLYTWRVSLRQKLLIKVRSDSLIFGSICNNRHIVANQICDGAGNAIPIPSFNIGSRRDLE